ncbi:hypothetical protein [Sphaerospermopsis reniformis]|uniref:hypothetical protein n=1 Tax=Sphaerospermopsis reniformis TaxID=531300 RepID=UPI0010F4815B|nr:hypothetical protein [Sphaerospermopsis reniformis]
MRLQLQLVISTLRIKSDCAERSAVGDRIFPRMIDNLEVAGDQVVIQGYYAIALTNDRQS